MAVSKTDEVEMKICFHSQKNIGLLLVNAITLSRFVWSALFIKRIMENGRDLREYILLFILIGLTDFYDGRLARKWAVQTKFGAVMDVMADSFFVIGSAYALFCCHSFPLWMVAVMILKLAEFVITSHILRGKKSNSTLFVYDVIGRGVAFAFYLLPITMIVMRQILSIQRYITAQNRIIFPLLGFCLISIFQRVYCCMENGQK